VSTATQNTRAGLTPSQFAALIGHDADFVCKLIHLGEISARNESLGSKQKRWRIDPDEAIKWQQRCLFTPTQRPRQAPMALPQTAGLLARKREARRSRRAS
jgi:hypothetical protein